MTIIFDIGNVLLNYDWMIPARKLGDETGIAAEEIYRRFKTEPAVLDFSEGRSNGQQFTEDVSRILSHRFEQNHLRHILEDMFWEIEGMAELVQRLKPHYPLMLLSNTNPWHWQWELEHFPVLSEFENIILSFEAGCSKPDRRIFELALSKAGDDRPVVFFDDMEDYVVGARAAGLTAFQFTSAVQAETELRRLGCQF